MVVGVKITLTLQLAPGATEPAQLVELVKLLLVTTEPMLTVVDPVLAKTTVWADEDVSINCPPNINCELLSDAPGTTPVPASDTICEPRLSMTVRVPDSAPAIVGAYLTLTMQVEPAASVP